MHRIQLHWQHHIAAIEREELLHVVIGRSIAAKIVRPDEIRCPLPAVNVREQQRAARHADDFGVAFHAGHERSLGDRALKIVTIQHADDLVALRGVFAKENLRPFGVVVVEAMRVVEKPLGLRIGMFVHDVGLEFAQFRPSVFEMIIGWTRPSAGDELNLWMFRLQHGVKLRVTLDVRLLPVLVADADHLHVERRGMTHSGGLGAPCARHRAIGEFNEINRVLDIGVEFFGRALLAGIELARESTTHDGHRFSTDVFTELEELEEAETERLEIIRRRTVKKFVVPTVDQQLALGDRADGFLPLITLVQFAAFHDASAGEPHEAGLHIRQPLHHVGAQTAGTILPRLLREQRNHIEINRARAIHQHVKFGFRVGGFWMQHGGVTRPIAGKLFQPGRVEQRSVRTVKFHAQLGIARCDTQLNREVVSLTFLHADTPKAFVGHTEQIFALRLDAKVVRVLGVEGSFIANRQCAARFAGAEFAPTHHGLGKLEPAILHQLRVKPAVRAEIDVFKENSPHRRIDPRTGLVSFNGECGGVCGVTDEECCGKRYD